MTTVPPPAVTPFPEDSIEAKAYAAAREIPGREPNDVNRLGYSIWAWLKEKRGTLEEAILNSGMRTEMPMEEIAGKVREALRKRGIEA